MKGAETFYDFNNRFIARWEGKSSEGEGRSVLHIIWQVGSDAASTAEIFNLKGG
jgi:hypothetical protein